MKIWLEQTLSMNNLFIPHLIRRNLKIKAIKSTKVAKKKHIPSDSYTPGMYLFMFKLVQGCC